MSKSILEVVHETAEGLHKAGVMNTQTMREFDALCLTPVKSYTPEQIKSIRLKNKVSQAVFANYLNTSSTTVKNWEQGRNKPKRLALRLLSLIERKGLEVLVS
ncbi:MAG: DNA-binding transcriptional regulator [Thioploca sp.]|nr:DNA-binding transcriptional regulator [Thioploca sp.]